MTAPDWYMTETTSCPLCGADDARTLFTSPDQWRQAEGGDGLLFTYVQCARCHLRYLNPRPSLACIGRFYGAEYVSHSSTAVAALKGTAAPPLVIRSGRVVASLPALLREWIAMNRWGGEPGASPFKKVVIALIGRLARVAENPVAVRGYGKLALDIGSGLGGFVRFMRQYEWEAFGVDISENAASIATAEMESPTAVASVVAIPFADGSFDLVSMNQSLEHMYQPRAAIAEVHRLLRPYGTLYINVPNGESITARIFEKKWIGTDAPRHVCLWSPETLTQLLNESGFDVDYQTTGSSTSSITAAVEFMARRCGCTVPPDAIRKNRFMGLLALPFVRLFDLLGSGENIYIVATRRKRDDETGET